MFPLWEPELLNPQQFRVAGMESTHSPIMILVVIVAEGFLFLPLRFWVQVAHPLKTQHHIKVGDLESALHPGR